MQNLVWWSSGDFEMMRLKTHQSLPLNMIWIGEEAVKIRNLFTKANCKGSSQS
jgi:hypothetical protein